MDNYKDNIQKSIDKIKADLIKLSNDIHSNPELCFEEFKAVKWLKEILKEHGFKIEDNSGGLETAFKASFKGKKPGPRVAFLSEYDALRGKGHACGHNIIATSAVGAAIGLSKMIKDIAGEVILLGTPAEEGGGGKIILLEEGEFEDVDYALMIHPGSINLIGRGGLAASKLVIEFKGKAAHSSNPGDGINALKALLEVFRGIDTLRSDFAKNTRVNGIITEGGEASNIIPDFAAAEFTVRATTRDDLEEVIKKIITVTEAARILTGAVPEVKEGIIYAERYPNMKMAEQFKTNMEKLHEKMNYPDPDMNLGSSDIGNVTIKLPAIHSYLKIVEENVPAHTEKFAEAAIAPRAEEVIIKAAKGLAMTGYDILTKPELREAINNEFNNIR